jgi:hypothetical protein
VGVAIFVDTENIFPRDRVTIEGVWIGNLTYWTLEGITRGYTLQITITQILVFSVTVFTALLANVFQRGLSPFL